MLMYVHMQMSMYTHFKYKYTCIHTNRSSHVIVLLNNLLWVTNEIRLTGTAKHSELL